MNVSEIISLARSQTQTNINDISDSLALSYLNLIKDKFWSDILGQNTEDRNWESWVKILVANKSWYDIPEVASDKAGAKKLKTLYISYDGEIYNDGSLKYVKASLVDPSTLPYEWSYYENNTSKDTPIYFIASDKLFIAPIPSNNVFNGLKLNGAKKIANYDINTKECDTKINTDYHDVLVTGVMAKIYQYQQDFQNYKIWQTEYERLSKKAIENMTDIYIGPFQMSYPEDRGDNYLDFKQI